MAKPKVKPLKPLASGYAALDSLAIAPTPILQDYISAVSEYVLNAKAMSDGVRKRAQIALSGGLGRSLKRELEMRVPSMHPYAGERNVAGALRSVRADVSESHELDGLRLAIEIKPINLAVGRAIWNRFGDVRAFAVNIHLKFPFAVVGGLLAVPTWEWKAPGSPSEEGAPVSDDDDIPPEEVDEVEVADDLAEAESEGVKLVKVSTRHLIERAERRFVRARLREIEADPAHLLEATALLAYDPDTRMVDPDLPTPGSGLRWDEFVDRLVDVYLLRFEQ